MNETSPDESAWNQPSCRRGFWALVVTQFQGAFNDNLLKMTVLLFLPSLLTRSDFPVTAVTTGLFYLPYLLFPALVGALADRYSKQQIIVAAKYMEGLIMALGLLAFLSGNAGFILAVLFLMATQSAFFSPAKYGILPEILPESRLSWGNGSIQLWTFVSIITGTAVASPLMALLGNDRIYLMSVVLAVLSAGGIVSAHFVTRPPAAAPGRAIPLSPWTEMGDYFRLFRQDRWLLLTMIGIAYFWFAGSLAMSTIIELGKEYNMPKWTSLLPAGLALGIGLGSASAGFLSRGKIEAGLIPLGALGLSIMSAALALPGYGFAVAMLLLFLLGFFGGLYDVPLAAALQARSPSRVKGGMIATSNFVTFAAMFLSSGLFFLLFNVLHLSPRAIFLVSALLTLCVSVYLCTLLPVFLLRLLLWVLGNTFYRVNVMGRANMPQRGGALLVANHTAFVDALVLTASTDRPIRFLMAQEIFEIPWVRPLAKAMQAIPVSATEGPRDLINALRAATQAIQNGELVCIFAEGQISRTGQMLPFRKGFERIMKGVDAPIIPVHIGRMWGSIFSYDKGKFFWKIPRQVPYPVTVNYGAPMPPTADASAVRHAIMQLGSEAYCRRDLGQPLVHRAFVRTVRRHPFRLCMADMNVPRLSYFKTYVGSLVFAFKLKKLLDEQPMVGVLVPPSVGGALTNIALQFMGKTPVNLNYTVSADVMANAAQQCAITKVVTSRAFLEKLPLEVPGESIYLEDVRETVAGLDRIKAMLLAAFLPVRRIERMLGAPKRRSQDDLATIIFSSGSEGDPKGVMLTHFNISSDIESCLQVFPHKVGYGMTGILPFFHSFGFTGTLWLPLHAGFFTVFYPSPLDAKAIGGLIGRYRPQFLISTPTFLQNFIRRCLPEEFSSLMYVIVGAEKLTTRVREAFRARFGIEPLEGYGATECAPVISVNVPDFRVAGYYQIGVKHGTVGHPIPGVSVRVVDPDTGSPLEEGLPGLLLVKGPNVMKGYLNNPQKTEAVLKDAWYNTGDIAAIDDDGFITITDRLARFSKIGGEMVPHNKIEDALHSMLGLTEQALCVVGVPDEAKGERLVVLHTLDDDQYDRLMAGLDQIGLPKLWAPKPNAFYRIEAIPVMGSGKVDIKSLKRTALELDLGE
ncbi:MAG TPA: acyl-[ACP]--phospholipid O-acyltransferase [Candidatus Hydrogenedentes bacterium]|nr:acyl-[ACP]--phospholipid O-acyltransferase [Candidatus Hydrogenedentota bacterium]HOS02201.1 acyl-[ACP]--phospholipid O-acyltransferase [Candidatus Hydrogenedentota bacterium]